jgi:hypothetical protein
LEKKWSEKTGSLGRAAGDGQLTAAAKVLTPGKNVVHLEAKTTDE